MREAAIFPSCATGTLRASVLAGFDWSLSGILDAKQKIGGCGGLSILLT
jgi:hypothetical protein